MRLHRARHLAGPLTSIKMRIIIILLAIITFSGCSQIFDNSKAGFFFKEIYSKHGDRYYPLDSDITFSDGVTVDEPDSYYSISSFIIVDSLSEGNEKYLIDITPRIVKQLSDISLYKGKWQCHWELSPNGCEWIGFSDGSDADFIWNKNGGGYSQDFVKALNKVDFQTKEEKETFCSSILEVISTHFAPDFTKCKRTMVDFDWIKNRLVVTHVYSEHCTEYKDGRPKEDINFSHVLEFGFENNRIINLKRIIKSR